MTEIQVIYDGPIVKWSDARKQGLKRYFNGNTCSNGHVDERYFNSGRCVTCNSERSRRMNDEKGRLSDLFIGPPHVTHSGSIINITDARELGQSNYFSGKMCPNGHISLRRVCNSVCISCAKAKSVSDKQKYRDYNREYLREYRKGNPELFINYARRRSGCEGRHTVGDVYKILERQGGLCVYCNVDIREEYHVDHIMPIALGGSNWPSNLQCLCPTCNLRKHAKHPDDWHREIGYQTKKQG